jgi:hypothetical protein
MDIIEKRICINGELTKYLVDTRGAVFSEHKDEYLKPFLNPSGYLLVDLHHNHKSYYRQVHRLVAEAFIPNPDKLPTVNHIDGDKTNNRIDNLEWMSIKDNVRHAWSTGLAKPRCGVDNPANVYTEEQIHKVCEMLEVGTYNHKQIAEMCGTNVTLIRDIKFRGKWKHIASLYNINHIPIGMKDRREELIKLIKEGYTNKQILEIMDLPESKKRHIEGVRYRYIHSLNDYPSDGSTPISSEEQ